MIIPGYSSYDIDEHGTITNIRTGDVLKSNTVGKYTSIRLTNDDGKRYTENVHILMAMAFGLKLGNHYVISFKDSDQHNVELSNLESITRSELSKRNYNVHQKKRKSQCNTPDTRELIVNALYALDKPATMAYLSGYLSVPYSVIRYSLMQLVEDGAVEKTTKGFVLK